MECLSGALKIVIMSLEAEEDEIVRLASGNESRNEYLETSQTKSRSVDSEKHVETTGK